MENKNLIEIKNLQKAFSVGKKALKAINGVSINIKVGETLGLVGESGCGKSTLGRTVLGIYKPTNGKVLFKNNNVHKMNKKDFFNYCKETQMIFQDPYASLNPRMIVKNIIGEGIDIHKLYKKRERDERIYRLLELVGLNKEHANRFPHEFSGGQRQRISIARALAVEPEFIVCDEPIAALDVSIQAQIVNLLKELQEKFNLTYLFVAHDLSMVKYISDRVAVMYLGSVVEVSNSDRIYSTPLHPYTKSLLSAIPIADPKIEREKERIILKGDVPSPIDLPSGCPFSSRCPNVLKKCLELKPELKEIEDGHMTACFLYQ